MEPRPTSDGAIGANFSEERFSFLSRFWDSYGSYNTPIIQLSSYPADSLHTSNPLTHKAEIN